MPTFYAIVVASLAGYLIGVFFKEYSVFVSVIMSFVAWVLVYYFVRKWLNQLKP